MHGISQDKSHVLKNNPLLLQGIALMLLILRMLKLASIKVGVLGSNLLTLFHAQAQYLEFTKLWIRAPTFVY